MRLNNVKLSAWNKLAVIRIIQLTVYGDAGDVGYFNSLILAFVHAFTIYIINIVIVVLANIFINRMPFVLAVIRICAHVIFSVYSNVLHGEAALSISRAVLFIIVIGHFNQQRVITRIAVCPDMVFLRMTRSGSALCSVDIHVGGDISIRCNSVATIFLCLPTKEFIRAGRRIGRELISNFCAGLNVNCIIQRIGTKFIIQLGVEINLFPGRTDFPCVC